MKFFNLFCFVLFLCINYDTTAQSTSYKTVFNEQFDDNKNGWSISDSQIRKSTIISGKLIDELHNVGYQSTNLIDVNFNSEKNYALKFSIANLNYGYKVKKNNVFPTCGFVWSFKDWDNYNYIIFQQGFKTEGYNSVLVTYYKIGSFVAGNEIVHQKWTAGYTDSKLKAETAFNEITIKRSGNTLYFYSGFYSENYHNMMEGSCPAEKWFSPKCGILIGDESKVMLDYLTVEEEGQALVKTNKTTEIKPELQASSGSGILVTTDGYIVTNYHVVEDGEDFKVDLNINGLKKTYNAELIQGSELKVTDGIISSNTGYQDDPTTFQISAPIQPGNSGGPLFDMNGNLIGITNAGIQSAQNVGYSIKASYLMNFLETITAITKPASQSTLTGKPLPDIIDKLKPYTVLIRVNDVTATSAKDHKSPISSYTGGYYTNKLKDLSWNTQKNEWQVKNEFNFRSELYISEKFIGFKRGSNDWLGNRWTYVGYDSKQNIYNFYDERGQDISVDKDFKFVIFYFDRDPKTDKFINCAVYEDLVKDDNVKPTK